MTDFTIREILDLVPRGQIRVPAFQRGFVWDPPKVAYLMDSLYKSYPFGSLLLWRTREQLRTERQLGPFSLPDRDPDYPVDYVLDGQQRLTSIYGVFQTDIAPDPSVEWSDIYFDLGADADLQESQFVALSPQYVDPRRHFPLNTLFVPVAYRRATENRGEADIIRLDEMQARFKESRVPYQLLTTENRAKVSIVFARINRTGVPLDTLQLLTAWTWSEEFDLQSEFADLRDELAPFGFAAVGEDSDLILRCCAAVVAGDAAPATLVELRGADVRARFEEVANGIRGAIDFLRANLNVQTILNLPFATLLVPLAVYFARPGNEMVQVTDIHRRRLLRWFWRAAFSRRFSSGVLRNLRDDIVAAALMRDGQPSTLGDFPAQVTRDFFLSQTFRVNTVNTKTFVLMLSQHRPRTFRSGELVALSEVLRDYNRSEFHHVFPQAFLRGLGVPSAEHSALVNFCFLSRADNIALGGVAPSIYRAQMPADVDTILQSALIPRSLFADDFQRYRNERADILEAVATQLIT